MIITNIGHIVKKKMQSFREFVEQLNKMEDIQEAEYQGKKVKLDKPFRTPGEKSKFGVYVKDGDKVKLVRFGDPNMEIKRDDDGARKSFRARHSCDTKKDKTTAGYWSCKMWEKGKSVSDITEEE